MRSLCALLIAATVVVLGVGCARIGAQRATEQAIVAGEWQKVIDYARAWSGHDPRSNTPVYVYMLASYRLHREKLAQEENDVLSRYMGQKSCRRLDLWAQGLVKRHSGSARAWQVAAAAESWARRPDRALAYANKAVALDPRDPWSFVTLGNIEFGHPERVIRDCDRALAIDPNQPDALFLRGEAYDRKGDLARAIEDYGRAINVVPQWPMALVCSGDAKARSGDRHGALADMDTAIALDPKYADAYQYRGEVYLGLGNLAKAIKDETDAIKLNDRLAHAYAVRAEAYFREGNLAGAASDMTRYIKLWPGHAWGYYTRGIVYAKQGKPDKALRDFDRALKLAPGYTKKVLEPDRKWLEARHAWPPELNAAPAPAAGRKAR